MTNPNWEGIIPPVVTLLKQDGSLDVPGMQAHIDELIAAGVNGLFFMGTGGEFGYMSLRLRKQTAFEAVAAVKGRVPVLIGTGTASYEETRELSRHAEDIGADGIVVIPPYFWQVNDANLILYYKQLANDTNLPMLLYNFPGAVGYDLNPNLVTKLALEVPSILGIKETVDEAGHIREMILKTKEVRSDFKVFSGYDDHLLNTLMLGGDGAISMGVNIAPHLQIGIYKAFLEQDFESMMNLHRKLAYLPLLYKWDAPPINVVKEAMRMVGKNVEPYVFSPGNLVDTERCQPLREILQKAGLSNFDS
ncbi:dihydrodipicolinate synthase family protein [Salicibibacter cibi]|uniref:Dihydrodipicolinate synthase family protein n=1 Tax=Salicibibacter cibi TaxID=2743001 RepID=A0A7T6Z8L5_9BACI|nr:dihydrodipicolinate synthase family protein [Salicibibacter cibi]QQK78835.1 dihydrodipicolinate synthase family protein [Salicibibacter cibi]